MTAKIAKANIFPTFSWQLHARFTSNAGISSEFIFWSIDAALFYTVSASNVSRGRFGNSNE